MIRHDHSGIEPNSVFMLAQAVPKNQVTSRPRQRHLRSRAERDEQVAISLLQMRKPPPIPIFRQKRVDIVSAWGERPRPPTPAA